MFRCANDLPSGQGARKHDCPDCFFCQLCSDARCRFCRSAEVSRPKMSMAEQIAHYERLNAADDPRPDQPLTFRREPKAGRKKTGRRRVEKGEDKVQDGEPPPA